jgi:hypothetical protein
MFERKMLVPSLMAAMVCAGCASSQTTAGPTLSRDGVEVRVIGQECYVNRSADEEVRIVGDRLDIKVMLQLSNGTDSDLTVHPLEITLSDSEVEGEPSLQTHPASSFNLAPGQSKRFAVAFTRGGELDCSAQLALRLGQSVIVRGSAVAMPVLNLASSY